MMDYMLLSRWIIAATVMAIALITNTRRPDPEIVLMAMVLSVTIVSCEGCSCRGC